MSGNKSFSISEALQFGFNATKSNFPLLLGVMIVSWLVAFAPQGLMKITSGESNPEGGMGLVSIILSLIFTAFGIVIQMGLLKILLKIVNNQKAMFSDLFSTTQLFWKYLAAAILYGLIVLAGFILLIIPGIIFAIMYQFYSFLVVDKGLGPVEALKKSGELTKGVRGQLFLFGLAAFGINILGVLALGVGLLFTGPTTMIASAYIYKKLAAGSN